MKRALCILIAAIALPSGAAEYHVATTGNDSADGSSGTPWLTLQHAATNVTAGDTVNVAAGNYSGNFIPTVGGTAENYITYKGAGIETLVDGTCYISAPYIRVESFNWKGEAAVHYSASGASEDGDFPQIVSNWFFGSNMSPYRVRYAISISGGCSNAWVHGNQIISPYQFGMVLLGDVVSGQEGGGHLVTSNLFYGGGIGGIGGDALHHFTGNCTVRGNTWRMWQLNDDSGEHVDCIQVWSLDPATVMKATNNLFEANLFVDNYTNAGSVLMMEDQNNVIHDWTFRNNVLVRSKNIEITGRNIHWYNNTLVNSAAPFYYSSSTKGNCHGVRWVNNIMLHTHTGNPNSGFINFIDQGGETPTNVWVDFNLHYEAKNTAAWVEGDNSDALNGLDPLLVNTNGTTWADFKLLTNSPAIGVGTNLNAIFTADFAGVTRGASWDVGAFEFDASEPTVPQVTVTGNGVGIANGDATPSATDHTDFGSTAVGSTVSRTFTVANIGIEELTTSGLTVPSGYTVTEGLQSSLRYGESDTFTVRLDAAALGTYAGNVSFDNNDPDSNPFTFAITGAVTTAPAPPVGSFRAGTIRATTLSTR